MSMLKGLIFWIALSVSFGAIANDTAPDPATIALRQALQQRYPNTKFGEIQKTPMTGIWEVWMGNNVAYVTDEGRHFIFGHMYDMQTQTDLTAAKLEVQGVKSSSAKIKIDFNDLPFDDAIKVVRGTGERKIAVFSDPDCPYCRRLDGELDKLKDVTIYTFLFPLTSIHPEATSKAEQIWCSKDPALAWSQFMKSGKLNKRTNACKTPIERNIELATKAGVQGTPFILFANGERAAGALDVASLERRLSVKKERLTQ